MTHKNIPIFIGFLCALGLIAFIASAADYYNNYLNLREELPGRITEKNIDYGKIEAYLPDTLYKKYRLTFVKSNPTIKEERLVSNGTWGTLKDYKQTYYFRYVKDTSEASLGEDSILKNDSAISYLKYQGQDGDIYFFTITGVGGGSANLNELIIKLYKLKNNDYVLIFKAHETYSTDPGIDSHFFIEQLDLWLLKNILRDDRY